ncbi:thioesterase domain-containing protein, partial [Rhodococcus sp. NPDC058514]|uniref:thioesterase domain-containing protein n=1 Tax=Rhodococcus sp. NPDC058514 TaxID=3346532 RepID=UPI0036628BBA
DVINPLRGGGAKPPVFCLHPVLGVSWAFAGLAPHIDRERGIYGLQSPALSGEQLPETIEAWARLYVEKIRTVQPEGPYHLIGWSLGGVIAHAMAAQLQEMGEEIAVLAMMDSYAHLPAERLVADRGMTAGDLLGGLLPTLVADGGAGSGLSLDALSGQELSEDLLDGILAHLPAPFDGIGAERLSGAIEGVGQASAMTDGYAPPRFKGDVFYFAALEDDPSGAVGAATWQDVVDGRIVTHGIAADHWGMASPASLARIGGVLNEAWNADEEIVGE